MARKITQKISSEYQKYVRVWRLLKKPTMSELKTVSKISVIGLLVIGGLGFIINDALKLITSSIQ